jgi:hypothetical protein
VRGFSSEKRILSLTPKQIDELILAGADRLLARATNARLLTAQTLTKRLQRVTEKYVLRHDPAAERRPSTASLMGYTPTSCVWCWLANEAIRRPGANCLKGMARPGAQRRAGQFKRIDG